MVGVIRSVETKSCILSADSIPRSSLTGRRSVATNEVMRHTMMPAPEMVNGKRSAPHPAATIIGEEAPTSSAAHEASPNEPKRSEPIPATSPTLSPTLSAMVPGL